MTKPFSFTFDRERFQQALSSLQRDDTPPTTEEETESTPPIHAGAVGESKELFGSAIDTAHRVGEIEGKLSDLPTKSWTWRLVMGVGVGVLTLSIAILAMLANWVRAIIAIVQAQPEPPLPPF